MDKERRILEAALALAEQGGFDAVRQREVAARAGVALGTLYKRFQGKGDLLVGALEYESEKLDRRLKREPPSGESPLARARAYFEIATHYFVRKPHLGRAVIKAIASGDNAVSARMVAYQLRQTQYVLAALQGSGDDPPAIAVDPEEATKVATILLSVWFAALVGWSGGAYTKKQVVDQVAEAAELVLLGIRTKRSA